MPCKRSASGLSATLLSREQPKGKMLLVPRCTSGIADSSLLSASESLEKDLCLSVRTHAWQLLTCVSAFLQTLSWLVSIVHPVQPVHWLLTHHA